MQIHTLKHLIYRILLLIPGIAAPFSMKALAPDAYANGSKMSSGKWVKIAVPSQGMFTITNEQLRSLGFSDPSKVNVFGYGGRLVSEVLEPGRHADDLPLAPSVRSEAGLSFYGVSNVSWIPSTAATVYLRERNPYSEQSYYFLSDVEIADTAIPASTTTRAEIIGNGMRTFTDKVLHEQQITTVSNTGRLMLGEDFRSSPIRKFNFSLPGIVGDAKAYVRFGALTTNGSSSFIFSANGERLSASSSDIISGISGDSFISLGSFVKSIPNPGEKLEFEIKYSHTGALTTARLDYIIVEYERELKIGSNGWLAFSVVNKLQNSSELIIDGASADTQIWDVTVPGRPLRVEYALVGNTARFTETRRGYCEYVAVNTGKLTGTRLSPSRNAVANQDIHSMEVPDMLIITPSEYEAQARRIAVLHEKHDSMKVHVLTPEKIYNEFSSGTPDIGAWRKCLKMWYDRGEENGHRLRYCLLFGRPNNDPLGLTEEVKSNPYPRLPIWQSPTGFNQSQSYSTDDLVAMLEDATESSFKMSKANLSIGIGRMPVKSEAEARQMVDKLEEYILRPVYGGWRNNMLFVADDGDTAAHLNQSQTAYTNMRKSGNGLGEHYLYERLYIDGYPREMTPVGYAFPTATEKFLKKLNEGVMWINYIGHASPSEWTHEKFLTWNDICSLSNKHLPFLYAATCEFARWDDASVSGAEQMWLNPKSGIIGCYSASRSVYIVKNGPLSDAVAQVALSDTEYGKVRLGDIVRLSKNTIRESYKDDNRLRYLLMGDPAMSLPMPTRTVVAEILNQTAIGQDDEQVVIGALSKAKVSGSIRKADGTVDEDFNGMLEVVLMDAEQIVETNGNDTGMGKNDGIVSTYNDRKILLYKGKASVKDGRWEIEMKLPMEIANNYSPALLNMYAYSTEGEEVLEAVGSTEELIVYGMDPDADIDADQEGPKIELFTLNNTNFRNGDWVSPSPMVIAKFTDPSGINLSNGSIGHDISLQLDQDKPLTDVAEYYEAEADDPDSGTIMYQLSDIEPGEHTIRLIVWDNANNMSSTTLHFNVAANAAPVIYDITTDVNPATTSVNFLLTHDRTAEQAESKIEVYDLGGRLVWSGKTNVAGAYDAPVSVNWDLCDTAGVRVPRGIYIYRATVTTERGAYATKSKKLAVSAPK